MRMSTLARPFRAAILVLGTTSAAVLGVSSPSMAAGDNYHSDCTLSYVSCSTGVEVSYPGDLRCENSYSNYNSTEVCIQYDGDYVYVRDGKADGYAAMAFIDSSGNTTIRFRACRNNKGYGTWVRCNFDWSESATKYVSGGYKVDYNNWHGTPLWHFSNN